VNRKSLHVFGSSNVLNYTEINGAGDVEKSWPWILANDLNLTLNVHGYPAICNSYIASEILNHVDRFEDGIVIVLWSHWSRTTFCMETGDGVYSEVKGDSLSYASHSNTDDIVWMRSKGLPTKTWRNVFSPKQNNYSLPYYDYYFQHYYNDHQAHLETTEKMLLIKTILEKNNINYIFTAEDKALFSDGFPESARALVMLESANWFFPDNSGMLDLTRKHKWYVSQNDLHLTNKGHREVAKLFHNSISTL
jgi:hypothetical protein